MMEKKRVLLILPPNVNVIEPFSSKKIKQLPLLLGFPLGLGYIAAYLLKHGGYEVKIIDANKDNLSIEGINNAIKDFDPHYIGMTLYTVNSKVAVQLAKKIKDNFKDKPIIVGGPHVSVSYADFLVKYPFFDFAVIGEGEVTMHELLKALDTGDYQKLKETRGIAYLDKEKKEVFFTGERPLLEDIDKLPAPARELVDFNAYVSGDNLLPFAIEIMGSRGCSHRCVFCSFQKKWRARGAKEIIDEMKDLIERYPNVKSFLFYDDNFSVDSKRVIALCQEMIHHDLDKYMWSCLCRADQVTEDMLGWMKKAGCTKIMYGVETADPVVMEKINKKISLKQVKEAIELTTKLKIDALAFFIIGNPGETRETIKASYDFAKKLKCQSTVWSIMQVYPGTALAKWQPCEDFVSYLYEPELENPSSLISANIPVFENPGLGREEIKVIHKKVFRDLVIYKAINHPDFVFKKVLGAPLPALRFLRALLKK